MAGPSTYLAIAKPSISRQLLAFECMAYVISCVKWYRPYVLPARLVVIYGLLARILISGINLIP